MCCCQGYQVNTISCLKSINSCYFNSLVLCVLIFANFQHIAHSCHLQTSPQSICRRETECLYKIEEVKCTENEENTYIYTILWWEMKRFPFLEESHTSLLMKIELYMKSCWADDMVWYVVGKNYRTKMSLYCWKITRTGNDQILRKPLIVCPFKSIYERMINCSHFWSKSALNILE